MLVPGLAVAAIPVTAKLDLQIRLTILLHVAAIDSNIELGPLYSRVGGQCKHFLDCFSTVTDGAIGSRGIEPERSIVVITETTPSLWS